MLIKNLVLRATPSLFAIADLKRLIVVSGFAGDHCACRDGEPWGPGPIAIVAGHFSPIAGVAVARFDELGQRPSRFTSADQAL